MKRLFLMMALFIGMSSVMVNALELTIQDRQLVAIENGVETVISPNGTQWSYIWPSVSPDGQHIAYYVSGIGCYVANPDGSNPRFIARDLRDAKWLSNDELIGMNDQDDEYITISSSIVVYHLNGLMRQLTPDTEFAMHPKIDAANGRITYTNERDELKSMAYQFRLPVEAYQQAERSVIKKARKVNTTPGIAGKRIYINAGHGSWGPNDRPMATISHPMLSSTGMPDHDGFYESNTNLWKALECGRKLQEAGAIVVQSREDCGPWPYPEVNGEYPSYSWADYQNRPDYEQFNKALSAICEEVELGNYDYFLSIHSNANTEGTTTNFPIFLYSGYDNGDNMRGDSKYRGEVMWPYLFDCMLSGLDPVSTSTYSATNGNIRGDVNFMGSGSWSTRSNGNRYYGYYGVLKHGVPGFLSEGYFHTYQPARHRALNPDYCKQEGIRYFRGIMAYYGETGENVGYIMGTVKDLHEKIVNNLFNYNPKTNDQWLPLNGAVVKLYKAGVEIASYTVDNNYNGIFYFPDLVPGNDYTLEATMEGYKPLFDEYKQPITVEANKTTYPMIYLESETYEPPAIVYEDYAEPQGVAGYLGIAGIINLAQAANNDIVIEGTIKRTLTWEDKVIVLSHTADNEPHLYVVNTTTGAIAPISTKGLIDNSATNNTFYNKLSDIALTNDGVLVGCNYMECQFGDAQVAAGSQKGVIQFYKWDNLEATPTAWVVLDGTVSSANYYNANTGYTMAIQGSSQECTITTTAVTTGSSHAMRYPQVAIADGVKVSQLRGNNIYTTNGIGTDYRLYLSPRNNKTDWILAGELTAPVEFKITGDGAAITELSAAPAAMAGMQHLSFMRYNGHSLMGVYAENAAMYDITNGLNAAKAVELNGIAASAEETYKAAHLAANEEGWRITTVLDGNVKVYTSAGAAQPVIKHIGAYELTLTEEEDNYTFGYVATDNAVSTSIVFYQFGKVVGEIPVAPAVVGANSATIARADLPGASGTATQWGVKLEGKAIGDFGVIENLSSASLGLNRVFNVPNNLPESDQFGYVYIMNRVDANSPLSGFYVMDRDHNLLNTTGYKGAEPVYGSPYRISMDSEGWVWIADWADPHSGVYTVNPAEPDVHYKFFQGAQDANGLWMNAGTPIGSSTPCVLIYGEGAKTKLLVYNEDSGAGLPKNGLAIYNIGQPDGSILRSWGTAPSATITFAGQGNSNGNLYACEQGVWVSQHRGAGNNNSYATSLRFYTWDGQNTYSSYLAPVDEFEELIIQGSMGSCFTITPDGKQLILNGIEQDFMVFDIVWNGNTPTLNYKGHYKHNLQPAEYSMLQMQWDFAGNLLVSGDGGLMTFTYPTDENITIVPAKKALSVSKPSSGHIEGIGLDKDEVEMLIGSTETLTAILAPADAVETDVTWASSNASILTVADGVITALAVGEADVTVTTVTGGYTATCHVIVNPILPTGIAFEETAKTIYVGDELDLSVVFTPENTTDKSVLWSSSKAGVVSVDANGHITGLAVGTAVITAKSAVNEKLTATCRVTVQPIAVTGIELNIEETTVAVGETVDLVATILPENATNKNVIWVSDDEEVATVDANGHVTTFDEGEVTITVISAENNRIAAECVITVEKIAVASITLDKETATLLVGESTDIVATVLPENATNAAVVWTSSDPAIATVEDGHVVAVAEGTATITAVAADDETITAACVITVEHVIVLPTAIELSQAVAELQIGESVTLVATVTPENADNKAVVWSTSNELVATVAEGVVTAVAEGAATITATAEADENVHAACEITVIKLNDGLLTIAIDGVYYNNGTVYNPQGVALMVYNTAGQLVATGNGNINLHENGIYLVKTANGLLKVRK